MINENKQWLQIALRVEGSVVKSIYPQIIFCGLFGAFISVLYYFKLPVAQPIFGSVIPSIVLGLLLVFRTNTAYDRFWEGRKDWGVIVNDIRNLARNIWVGVAEVQPGDKEDKIAVLRLLVAFAVATKLHLRGESNLSELGELISPIKQEKLKLTNHAPLEIAHWIGDYLQQQHNHARLNSYQLTAMQELLNNMVNSMGACERILRTPIPPAYAIHLKQLLLIYCLLLPFQFVSNLGWYTGFFVALISFTLFGIEAIGTEIQNPFGYDANDLPIDNICNSAKEYIEHFFQCRECDGYVIKEPNKDLISHT
jgi:ion channel-forming bestrophin family protein